MQVQKLSVDAGGRVTGTSPSGQPVQHNSPSWPCRNGDSGGMSVPSGVTGMLVHTMVGDLQPGTVAWFNNSASQASAHFGVSQAGEIWQFGPVNGWKAWHAADGNPHWFGCEFADAGNPSNPLTPAQIAAGAQLLELLSRDDVGRFPIQISDSPTTEGLGWHGMGGGAFGGHPDCPGDVRKVQRPQIVALAIAIRQGGTVTPPAVRQWVTAGMSSLEQLASQQHTTPAVILALTAAHSPGGVYPAGVASYLGGVFGGTISPAKPMPKDLVLYLPSA